MSNQFLIILVIFNGDQFCIVFLVSTNSDQASMSPIKEKEPSEQSSTASTKQPLGKSLSAAPTTKTAGQNKSDDSSSADDEIVNIAIGRKDLKRYRTILCGVSNFISLCVCKFFLM